MGGASNGLSERLDGDRLTDETRSRSREILRNLREKIDSEDVREWEAGRPGSIQAQEILQSYLRKLQETPEPLDNLPFAREEAQERFLRGLRAKEKPSCPPHRSEPGEQRIGEHSNSLHPLPSLLAQDSGEIGEGHRGKNAEFISLNAWRPGWEGDTPRVAKGVPARVDRLRGLGNAVVPQVVEWIGRRILEAEYV
jgi:site-specific DNA-cytosine methylase